MSIRINGIPVQDPQAQQALQIVAQNPQAYDIRPRRRAADIDFTPTQVLQILNPYRPQQNRIDTADMGVRFTQQHAPMEQDQFISLAREFQTRFSDFLNRRHVRIDARIFQVLRPRSTPTPLPSPSITSPSQSERTSGDPQIDRLIEEFLRRAQPTRIMAEDAAERLHRGGSRIMVLPRSPGR